MGYKEKFQKYLDGKLEEEEAGAVREDMERLEVLLAFMDESMDEELFENGTDEETGAGRDRAEKDSFSKAVSKAVNRKLRKYAAVTGGIVLVTVFLLIYGLSPFLNMICYNPAETEEIHDVETESAVVYQPFQLSLAVYMELFSGEKGFASANVREEGYGRYMVDVQTQVNGETSHYPLTLERNHLYIQDLAWNASDIPGNAFTYYYKGETGCSISADEACEKLSDLPETLRVRAALSFEEIKDAEELVEFMERYEAQYLYIPIEVHAAGFTGYWGFTPKSAGYDITKLYSQEEYPYLDLFQYEGDGSYPPDVLTEHVKSMIKFMMAKENERFLEIFDSAVPGKNVANPIKYREALDYIDAYGVNGYGIVVSASKQQLLDMIKDASIDGVYMLDSMLDLN